MRYTNLATHLRAWGLTVVETDGWKTRGDATFAPKGVVCHHTAGPVGGGDMPSLGILIHGRPGLSGPLCQVGLGRSGVVYLVAAGRANHAGAGGWKGLSGNTQVWGIEAENNGSQIWPAAQITAYHKLAAALMALSGSKDAGLVCGHKEWAPSRKIDPHTLDMNAFRHEVAKHFAPAPAPTPVVTRPATTITNFPGDNMRRIDMYVDTDGNGNGWTIIANQDASKVVSIVTQGPYPPADGYWNLGVYGRQQRGSDTIITISEFQGNLVGFPISVWVVD